MTAGNGCECLSGKSIKREASRTVLAYLTVVRRPLAAALTSGARVTASPGELQLRNALAVVQFAGVLTLLSGAATLARESRPGLAPTTA